MSESALFWEARYANGDSSGSGSRGHLGQFKADYLNAFVANHRIEKVIEFGCGEGVQLELAKYPRYLGLDVSPTAIESCRARFPERRSWDFEVLPSSGRYIGYDLSLSLDVIYHLIEDEVYEKHMSDVFMASGSYVVLYTSDQPDVRTDVHVRHRPVSSYVEVMFPEWELIDRTNNPWPPESDFLAYRRMES